VGLSAFVHKERSVVQNPSQKEKSMLLTPTFVGLLLAGAAFWALVWAAIHKLDEIPYLKEFTSTQEVLDWIERHKGLTLVITEGVNFLLHGLSPHGVMFTLGGTIINFLMVFGYVSGRQFLTLISEKIRRK
jgi:hypothetical protein